jgi:hypothetical protein
LTGKTEPGFELRPETWFDSLSAVPLVLPNPPRRPAMSDDWLDVCVKRVPSAPMGARRSLRPGSAVPVPRWAIPPFVPGPLSFEDELITELALRHPAWGSVRISNELSTQAVGISAHNVQMRLIKHGLGRRDERLGFLERQAVESGRPLTDEQVALIEKHNPAFRQRNKRPAGPGDMLVHDVIPTGSRPRFGRLYVHAFVDTFSSFSFARVSRSLGPQPSIAILADQLLPHFLAQGRRVGTVETARYDCVTPRHADSMTAYLAKLGIRYQVYCGSIRSGANGFAIGFRKQLRRDFLDYLPDGDFFDSLEDLQTRMDLWLLHQNFQQNVQGYPNMNSTPASRVSEPAWRLLSNW